MIPGVQVSTYDVGGTQSFQQSSLSAHGSSTNDVSYNIDGATVNWPGGGGGATMMYYDQGMFEEVNYMTSAIPAEVMTGGVSINMVTKDAGNKWRGDMRGNYATGCLTPQNPAPGCLESDNLSGAPGLALGNPTQSGYDLNFAGGGALIKDRLWVNGAVRRWIINKLVNAKNDDGTQAIDDNTLKNYSGKAVASISANQKLSFSYNWDNKIRGHRRDTPPDFVPDIASLVQTNPASSTQARYTGIHNKTVFESSFSIMKGETDYSYQPNTPANAIRVVDATLDTANNAAQRNEQQPNSRIQFDNSLTYSKSGWGGDHLFKGGVQFARLYFDDAIQILGDEWLNYSNGVPINVQEWNSPSEAVNVDKVFGVFGQDAWSIGRNLTLNLGVRFDHNTGTLPAQSTPAGTFVPARSIPGVHADLAGTCSSGAPASPTIRSRTARPAIKASASRYGLQVGIDRVLNRQPVAVRVADLPVEPTRNKDGIAESNEYGTGCSGFPSTSIRYAGANGPRWPYSDELTAGIERELIKNMRVGVMYYHRTNRDQIGTRNTAAVGTAYQAFTINVPNGPGGTVASPKPTTATVYNLLPAFNGLKGNIVDNDPFLNTNYDGIEITAQKRMSQRWQMVGRVHLVGKNTGGINAAGGQSATADLNDPNIAAYAKGIVGSDSLYAFRLSGSYRAAAVRHHGRSRQRWCRTPAIPTCPPTFGDCAAAAAAAGVTLTRGRLRRSS